MRKSVAKKPGLGSSNDVRNIDLIEAAERGDLHRVEQAIQEGVCINTREEGSLITALHAAAGRGHRFVVEYLLSRPDIDVFLEDRYGRTAHKVAGEAGQNRLAKLIYDKAFPDNRDIDYDSIEP